MIELRAGNYELSIEPNRGGSVARFDWNGLPLFRQSFGSSMLQTACFPLVPFSNRIADGVIANIPDIPRLAPNMPDVDAYNPIHGFGWVSAWTASKAHDANVILNHSQDAGPWPWRYSAQQRFSLSQDGLEIEILVQNDDHKPMPAGIGFHPYFPREAATVLHGMHTGECQNDARGIPFEVTSHAAPIDWWAGAPVETRNVDTGYSGRCGPLIIDWPNRDLRLSIEPDARLSETVIYIPAGEDYFCVEPVSHLTNAINRPELGGPMALLQPGEMLKASVTFKACFLSQV